jgi:cell division protein FtsQ
MDVGTPTIDVDGDAITMSILEDPWIESVMVEIVWPGSILIEVKERTPVAPVLAGEQWVLVAGDGGVIRSVSDPGTEAAVVVIDQGSLDPGDVISDPATLGALDFVRHLNERNRAGARIEMAGEGLQAQVAGHLVRLGRPVDMAEKAAVLNALLNSGIEPGASIDLIAPLRPAVTNPQPVLEVEE